MTLADNTPRTVKLFSNLGTSVAYDAPEGGPSVELKPGVNVFTYEQMDALHEDKNFRRHFKDGFVVELPHDFETPADMNVSVSPPTAVPAAQGGSSPGDKLTVPADGANGLKGGNPDATPARPGKLADESDIDFAARTEAWQKARRTQQKGEKKAAYAERIAGYDAEDAAHAEAQAAEFTRVSFLASFNGMTPDEQTAMAETLTDEEKAWVDADRATKAQA